MTRRTHSFALAALLFTVSASADAAPEGHDCQAPSRPADEQDDRRWQAFLHDVDIFRACISDFTARSERAAAAHREAARAAVDDWNAFVRRELNAPADFPWPGGQAEPGH